MPTGTKEEFEAAHSKNRCYSLFSKGEEEKNPPKGGSGVPHRGEPLLKTFIIADEIDKDLLKDTKGKLRLTLVPRKIITAIARVREYGNMKYKTSDSWKLNSKENYQDAAFRHFIAYLDDNESVDEESGLPHLHHLATNIAFLIEGGFRGV